jgi:hypothetical protein
MDDQESASISAPWQVVCTTNAGALNASVVAGAFFVRVVGLGAKLCFVIKYTEQPMAIVTKITFLLHLVNVDAENKLIHQHNKHSFC